MTWKVAHLPWKAFSFFPWTLAGEVKAHVGYQTLSWSSGSKGVSLTVVTHCWLQESETRAAGLFLPCLHQEKASVCPTSQLLCMSPSFIFRCLLSPKIPTSEEDLSFKLNPFSVLFITIFITAPLY